MLAVYTKCLFQSKGHKKSLKYYLNITSREFHCNKKHKAKIANRNQVLLSFLREGIEIKVIYIEILKLTISVKTW